MLFPCSHPDSYRRPQNHTESALAPKYEGSRAIPPVGTFTQTLQGVFVYSRDEFPSERRLGPRVLRQQPEDVAPENKDVQEVLIDSFRVVAQNSAER